MTAAHADAATALEELIRQHVLSERDPGVAQRVISSWKFRLECLDAEIAGRERGITVRDSALTKLSTISSSPASSAALQDFVKRLHCSSFRCTRLSITEQRFVVYDVLTEVDGTQSCGCLKFETEGEDRNGPSTQGMIFWDPNLLRHSVGAGMLGFDCEESVVRIFDQEQFAAFRAGARLPGRNVVSDLDLVRCLLIFNEGRGPRWDEATIEQ